MGAVGAGTRFAPSVGSAATPGEPALWEARNVQNLPVPDQKIPPSPPFPKGGTGGELFNPFTLPVTRRAFCLWLPAMAGTRKTRIELHATHWAIDPNATPRTIISV